MLTHATLLLMALGSPQDSSAGGFSAQVDRVRVAEHGDAAEIVALDTTGMPIGVISVWADSGAIHVDSDYDDGYLHIELVDGGPIIDSNLDPVVAGERAELLFELTLDAGLVQRGWGSCAFAATGTVIAAVSANPWVIGGAIASACSCLPMIIEDFKELKCPYW